MHIMISAVAYQKRLGSVDHQLDRLRLLHRLLLLAERHEGALAAPVLAQGVVLRFPAVQLPPAEEAPGQVGLIVGWGEVESGGRHLLGSAVGALGLGERPVGKGPEEDSAAS